MTSPSRPYGYYCVRRFAHDPEWSVAQWTYPDKWYTVGDFAALDDKDFAEISETPIEMRGTKSCA